MPFKIEKTKTKNIERSISAKVSININAIFSKSKMDIEIKKLHFEKNQLLHEVPTTYTNLYAKFGNNQAIDLATISV